MGSCKKRLSSVFVEAAALLITPLALIYAALFQSEQSLAISSVVLVASLCLMAACINYARLRISGIVLAATLAALAAAGRMLFAPFPSFKPVSALTILSGMHFGRQVGFLVGALAALISNFFFGQGPWTLWQMYSWGLMGWLASFLAPPQGKKPSLFVLCCFGFASAFLFGFLMNTWHIVGFLHPFTWQGALLVYGAGLPFDITHALSTVLFLTLMQHFWHKKIERIVRKYRRLLK